MIQNGRRQGRRSPAERKLLQVAGNPSTVGDAVWFVVSGLLDGTPTPPTELESLEAKLNISGVCGEDIPFSGELRREGKKVKIIYSSRLASDRRRFTIAHEMGHALLHKLGHPIPHSGPEVERLCDKLAAEILMPRDAFLQRLGTGLTIERLFQLRRAFDVSISAISFRTYELHGDSVFEIDNGIVSWGVGLVAKGPVHLLETGLRLAIDEAHETSEGHTEVFFVDRGEIYRGELEWSRRSQGKALFILRRNLTNDLAVTPTGF